MCDYESSQFFPIIEVKFNIQYNYSEGLLVANGGLQ
jgi:hypothetical protein